MAENLAADNTQRLMTAPAPGTYHVLHFRDGKETDAFVRALQRFLDGPRGSGFAREPCRCEVWAPATLDSAPVEIYLSDDALEATRAAFAPVPVAETRSADGLPRPCLLILRGATLGPL
jgi:hypothetical protein